MTYIDAHCHLILHHVHELAKGCIFLRRYQMVLIVIIIAACTIIISFIVYHISDKTNLHQVSILCHWSEFEPKFLLSRIVEVSSEKSCCIILGMLVLVIRFFSRSLAFCAQLFSIENEKVNLADHDLVGQRIFCGDRIILMVSAL